MLRSECIQPNQGISLYRYASDCNVFGGVDPICQMSMTDYCYVILGTIKFVDKSVNGNSVCRLDHCDVIASRGERR